MDGTLGTLADGWSFDFDFSDAAWDFDFSDVSWDLDLSWLDDLSWAWPAADVCPWCGRGLNTRTEQPIPQRQVRDTTEKGGTGGGV